MKANAQPSSKEIEDINKHLDDLLGINARKPGAAAGLPAVIRIIEKLEPAGGKSFPVFPPSYAGEGNNAPPVYDLNGIEWGQRETTLGNGAKRVTPYIKNARHCTMDAPQSHANRTEIAFTKDERLRALVPKLCATFPRDKAIASDAGLEEVDVLTLPHRIADFRIRGSSNSKRADDAIKAFAKGDALPLLQLMPTSLIFGFWDSRAVGYQHKHSRILLTRIDAFNVVPCEKHALYSGPYSKDECAAVVLNDDELADELAQPPSKMTDRAKQWDKAMAERGFVSVPSSGLGGVILDEKNGRIERLGLISLTDIASIFCQTPDKPDWPEASVATNAARRYLLALALLAESYPRSTGSYRLRSGCELVSIEKREIVLRGGDTESAASKALLALCENRELLIAVAESARSILRIEPSLVSFLSDSASLRCYLGKDIKSEKDAERQRKAAEKAAQKAKSDAEKARTRANRALDAAALAEAKATESGKEKDKSAAEKKRREADELSAEAANSERTALEAAEKLKTYETQPSAAANPIPASPETQITPRSE